MTKALNKRISDAFGKIYDMGDSGLDYMDRVITPATPLDEALMEHLYNNTLDTLSNADKTKMAVMLEEIVSNMEFEL